MAGVSQTGQESDVIDDAGTRQTTSLAPQGSISGQWQLPQSLHRPPVMTLAIAARATRQIGLGSRDLSLGRHTPEGPMYSRTHKGQLPSEVPAGWSGAESPVAISAIAGTTVQKRRLLE